MLQPSSLIPKTTEEIDFLLNILLLDKAIYELSYELNNRPDWVGVPIEGIVNLVPVAE